MSKSKSIYVWDDVDDIIQIIESKIDFIYHTTGLYYLKFYSKEDEDNSLQYFNYIRELLQIKKLLEVGYGFKSNYFSINESFTKFQGCCQSRRTKNKLIFSSFGNGFVPSSKHIILKGQPILYSLKKGYMWL